MTETEEITVTTTTAPTKLSQILEAADCGRCGGSGRHSFCAMYGDTCFGCGGTGRKLTKRGIAAKAYWEYLLSLPVEQLRVGDRIFDRIDGWGTVTAIADNADERSTGAIYRTPEAVADAFRDGDTVIERTMNGERAWVVYGGMNISVERKGRPAYGLGGKCGTVMVSPGECRAAILKSVAAYQAMLTKTGKPAKASRIAISDKETNR